jgi:signal transduction histidine kinase
MRDAEELAKSKVIESDYLHSLVRILCHDFSNPLTVVMTSTSIARRNPETANHAKLWDRVDRAGKTFKELIDSVRHMESINSGKYSPKLVPVDLLKVIDHSLFIFEEKLKAKNIRIATTSNTDEESIFVSAEKTGLSNSIFNNIISNAIKFSRRDSQIEINTEINKDKIDISITDHGIGMPEELIGKVFNPYASTSRLGTENEQGTGFGMPLVKRLTILYGGTIKITSNEQTENSTNHGTTITLSLNKPQV